MTAHVIFSTIDPHVPASLSAPCLNFLRQELAFTGAIISDDLEMRAITQYTSPDQAAVLAIQAGCDFVLMCHSVTHTINAIQAIKAAHTQGILNDAQLNLSLIRNRQLRHKAHSAHTGPFCLPQITSPILESFLSNYPQSQSGFTTGQDPTTASAPEQNKVSQ